MSFSANKERIFWIFFSAVLLFFTTFFHLQDLSIRNKLNLSQQQVKDLQLNLEKVQRHNKNLASDLASANQQVLKLNTSMQHLSMSNHEIVLLKQKGLPNPVENISQDLRNHREIIRYKGVLGGTMGFYDKLGIHVLNKKWVLADFDDGHINGHMLLEYDVKEGGIIKWRLIDQYLD